MIYHFPDMMKNFTEEILGKTLKLMRVSTARGKNKALGV